jgi:hypothetical protein
MRLVVGTVKKVLLTCVGRCCAETTNASSAKARYGADVVSLGGNIERSTIELHGYCRIRVARDYHLRCTQIR